MVQLSHPSMTTGKTIALTRPTFVGKVMSLLFNMLSKLVIAFLPRIKCLLISWLQSPSAGILEPKKIKSVTVSIVSLPICHEVMGPDAIILGLSFPICKMRSIISAFPKLYSGSAVPVRYPQKWHWPQQVSLLQDFSEPLDYSCTLWLSRGDAGCGV